MQYQPHSGVTVLEKSDKCTWLWICHGDKVLMHMDGNPDGGCRESTFLAEMGKTPGGLEEWRAFFEKKLSGPAAA